MPSQHLNAVKTLQPIFWISPLKIYTKIIYRWFRAYPKCLLSRSGVYEER
ncbi:MAG: hypothetical protein PHR87_09655 [Sulfurospirillaceae bacterium]|nr:hypothetical protein [Sulfurospirillaceae bacterium]